MDIHVHTNVSSAVDFCCFNTTEESFLVLLNIFVTVSALIFNSINWDLFAAAKTLLSSSSKDRDFKILVDAIVADHKGHKFRGLIEVVSCMSDVKTALVRLVLFFSSFALSKSFLIILFPEFFRRMDATATGKAH